MPAEGHASLKAEAVWRHVEVRQVGESPIGPHIHLRRRGALRLELGERTRKPLDDS